MSRVGLVLESVEVCCGLVLDQFCTCVGVLFASFALVVESSSLGWLSMLLVHFSAE